MKETLVIGDVHGHYDRLRDLLIQEGIIDRDRERRITDEVEVVQLGDLGHFGADNPTGDRFCYSMADKWFDAVLWGNHDRAVVDNYHLFSGYRFYAGIGRLSDSIMDQKAWFVREMNRLEKKGILKAAHGAHGYLITHAGMHPAFDDETLDELDQTVTYINKRAEQTKTADRQYAIIDAIGRKRGGAHMYGGILWRDWDDEEMSDKFPQIVGHTVRKNGKVEQKGCHWNIDIGGKTENRLAGIWLPQGRVVSIDKA